MAPFPAFLAVFAIGLMGLAVVVLTDRGQGFLVKAMRWAGTHSSMGPWAFEGRRPADPVVEGLSSIERLQLAESYLQVARVRTVRSARIVLWVLIGGCVTTAATGVLISPLLPPLVVSGAWNYEQYSRVSLFAVHAGVAGGVLAAVGLVIWLLWGVIGMTSTHEANAARDLAARVSHQGVDAELARELARGRSPDCGSGCFVEAPLTAACPSAIARANRFRRRGHYHRVLTRTRGLTR